MKYDSILVDRFAAKIWTEEYKQYLIDHHSTPEYELKWSSMPEWAINIYHERAKLLLKWVDVWRTKNESKNTKK